MADRQAFDPRFDPAFQRGYEPAAHSPQVPRPRLDELIGPPPTAEAVQPHAEPHGAEQVESTTAAVIPRRRGFNPYIVILWIVGVVCTTGGTALLFVGFLGLFAGFSASPERSMNAQFLYVLSTTFATPLITVGLATVAGLIFFSAWKSWLRHGRPTP